MVVSALQPKLFTMVVKLVNAGLGHWHARLEKLGERHWPAPVVDAEPHQTQHLLSRPSGATHARASQNHTTTARADVQNVSFPLLVGTRPTHCSCVVAWSQLAKSSGLGPV